MRKAATLLGLGSFLITMAVLLKFYAYPNLAVVPLDLTSRQIAIDHNAKFFDADIVKPASGTITTVATVISQKQASIDASKQLGRKVSVIEASKISENNSAPPPMDGSTQRFAIDRNTGEAVNCCDENSNKVATKFTGLQIKFPFDTQKQTYQFWDTTVNKAYPVVFQAEDSIQGMKVYRFQQQVPETIYRKQEVPDFVFNKGSKKPAVAADRSYQNVRTIWVDPNTGVMIDYQEQQKQFLIDPKNPQNPVIAVDTTSRFDAATVNKNIKEYKLKGSLLSGLKFLVPAILAVLGLLLLGLGLLLWMLDRRKAVVEPTRNRLDYPLVGRDRLVEERYVSEDEVRGVPRAGYPTDDTERYLDESDDPGQQIIDQGDADDEYEDEQYDDEEYDDEEYDDEEYEEDAGEYYDRQQTHDDPEYDEAAGDYYDDQPQVDRGRRRAHRSRYAKDEVVEDRYPDDIDLDGRS